MMSEMNPPDGFCQECGAFLGNKNEYCSPCKKEIEGQKHKDNALRIELEELNETKSNSRNNNV